MKGFFLDTVTTDKWCYVNFTCRGYTKQKYFLGVKTYRIYAVTDNQNVLFRNT
ncbi:hypothetical protein EMIT079MI2_310007 [Bacillus sp. IT-79MI2]